MLMLLLGFWALPIPQQGEAPRDFHPVAQEVKPQSCGRCHPKQYQDWRNSLHARAASKGLLGQLRAFEKETQRECLSCHLPRSEQLELWETYGPAARERLRGVDCTACHLRVHQRFGPRARDLTPHGRVKRLELFRKAEFCSPCHQFDEDGVSINGKPLENTYNEWWSSRYAAARKPCQSCHMRNGAHDFKGIHDPDMTRRGLGIAAVRDADGIRVRVWNAGAGHALPTYVTPRIRIQLEWVESGIARQREYIIQRQVDWDPANGWKELSDTRLFPGQAVELAQQLTPAQGASVNAIVEPDADYHDRVYPTLLEMLVTELSAADRRLLESAQAESGQSIYILYSMRCAEWQGREAACSMIQTAHTSSSKP